MAVLITIAKGVKVTQVVATNVVPPVKLTPRTLERLDEIQGIQQTRMSVEWRKETLFQQLDLSGLERWSEGYQAAAQALLAEYHDIFSLNQESWGVQIWQSMRSGSLMMNPSRRGSKGSPNGG